MLADFHLIDTQPAVLNLSLYLRPLRGGGRTLPLFKKNGQLRPPDQVHSTPHTHPTHSTCVDVLAFHTVAILKCGILRFPDR